VASGTADGQTASSSSSSASSSLISRKHFSLYLTSEMNDAFNPLHKNAVYQDMTQPLTHYYIASSHNTYLEGECSDCGCCTGLYEHVNNIGSQVIN
jgi:hypothetical protein